MTKLKTGGRREIYHWCLGGGGCGLNWTAKRRVWAGKKSRKRREFRRKGATGLQWASKPGGGPKKKRVQKRTMGGKKNAQKKVPRGGTDE